MKKNAKKKAIATLVALVLVIACAVGATFAWFTDSTAPVTNTFVVGNIDIVLYENNDGVVDTVVDQDTANAQNTTYTNWLKTNEALGGKNLLPGEVVAKEAYVKNIGANEAWVLIEVKVEAAANQFIEFAATDAAYQLYTSDNEVGGYYVYVYVMKEKLAVDATTAAAIKTFKIKDSTTQSQLEAANYELESAAEIDIVVTAYAIQDRAGVTYETAFDGFYDLTAFTASNFDQFIEE